MRFLFTFFACFVIAPVFAQNLIPFGGTRPQDTAYAARSIRVDSVVKLLRYASSDSNKVIGIDAGGQLVLRTKTNAVSTDSSIFVTASRLNDTASALRAAITSQPSPDLQEVTDAGNTTTNDITAWSVTGSTTVSAPIISTKNLVVSNATTSGLSTFTAPDHGISANYAVTIPPKSGIIAFTSDLSDINLQTVTDNGSYTTNVITVADDNEAIFSSGGIYYTGGYYEIGNLRIDVSGSSNTTNLLTNSTAVRSIRLPDSSGTVALTSNIPSTPTLDQVLVAGNVTGNSIVSSNSISAAVVEGIQLNTNQLSISSPATTGVGNIKADLIPSGQTRNFELPNASGTLALTSNISPVLANNGITKSGDTLQLGDTVKKAITVNIAPNGSLGFLGVGTTEKPILVHGLRYFNQNNRRNIMFVSYDPNGVLNGSSTRGTYIGPFPFQNILTGTQNVGVGHDPGNSCQTCSHNIAIGAMALYNETQVDDAIAIGRNSLGGANKGNNDIGIGQQAGSSGTTANCGFFGNYAGFNLSGTNTTVLGNWTSSSPVRSLSNVLLLGGDGANAQNVLIGKFTNDGSKLQVGGSITTDQPTASGAGAMKLGKLVTTSGVTTWEISVDNNTRKVILAESRSFVKSPSAAVSMAQATDYIFNGTTATWTLPDVASSGNGDLYKITIKNQASGSLTINSSAGSQIFVTAAQASISLGVGESVTFMPDGTYWNVE